jgi:membrane-bound metal-dependent hydrolase YbcI (DUF457 family)
MMGRSHVTSGAVAWLGVAVALAMAPPALVLGAVVCAGAAVIPDIDHPGSGISRTFGPITGQFARLVQWVSGGHRNGTHSKLGSAVFTHLAFTATALHTGSWPTLAIGTAISAVLAMTGWLIGTRDPSKKRGKPAYKRHWQGRASLWLCGLLALGLTALCALHGRIVGSVLLALALVLVLAAMIRVLRIKGWVDDAAPVPAALFLVFSGVDVTVVPYAIALGVVVHIAGDWVTEGGCPLGWPWSQRMFSARLFKTNGPVENRVVFPVLVIVMLALAAFGTGVLDLSFDDPARAGTNGGTP